ncbi:YL1_C domain-containing protein [Pseudozyma hubeiensis]|nr:YL1_C domain-containing protein [Pseudozyma hubeiensis]
MSRSRSSPVAGSSRSPSPEPVPSSSYRIERFDPTSAIPSDLMVTSRSKRSTAGNRLKALLDQELEKDEVFAEVENDIDFEANENEAVDIVDSDFDRESDDDAKAAEDESEGEREIEAQEKADKQKRRAQARNVGIIKRPAPIAPKTRRPAPTAEATQDAKRRRISFAPDQPSSSTSNLDSGRRRTSARSFTVQSKREVESRLEEASQRRAAQPVKQVVKKKASLTQDALIAEALEVEEENRESLRRFLEQEKERRAKQRQRKERITGPFVRWMSVGLKTRVVEEISADDKREQAHASASGDANASRAADVDAVKGTPAQNTQQTSANDSVEEVAIQTPTPPPAHEATANATTVTAPAVNGGPSAGLQAPAAHGQDSADRPSHADSTSAPLPTTATSPQPSIVKPSRPQSFTSAPSASTPASNASLTLDPVIAARQEASLLRASSTSATAATATNTASSSSSRYELQSRTLLSIERLPEDWDWLDEYNTLFGSHCSWDSYPFVPSRNRPLKPRQSICPITGLPAIYKDPRTGIAYGNKEAYKVITKLLEGKWRWTGGHYQDHHVEEKKKKVKGQKSGGGMVGVGAVPPEMGIYGDDEDEAGAGNVWSNARERQPLTTQPKSIPVKPKPNQPPSSPTAPSQTQPQPSPTPPSHKNRSKPGFDLILTNAIAPGDEKSVLAAALSLPAGSTRSGRRVQRS